MRQETPGGTLSEPLEYKDTSTFSPQPPEARYLRRKIGQDGEAKDMHGVHAYRGQGAPTT